MLSPPSLEITVPVPRQGLHRSSRAGSSEPLRSVGGEGTGGRAYRLALSTPDARQVFAAARISSSGAGRPDHRSKESAPWRTSTSSPSTTVAPAARAAATRRVSLAP